uniref:Uncharacterized protein n=1 Tax=Rhizophora mucronata TaxID=61149 RepID=A0A2P2P3P3_RHIMU
MSWLCRMWEHFQNPCKADRRSGYHQREISALLVVVSENFVYREQSKPCRIEESSITLRCQP